MIIIQIPDIFYWKSTKNWNWVEMGQMGNLDRIALNLYNFISHDPL